MRGLDFMNPMTQPLVHDPLEPHVLIIGACETTVPEKAIRAIVHEIMHDERTNGLPEADASLVSIVLSVREPSDAVHEVLNDQKLEGRITFKVGTVFKAEDRERLLINKAEAVFLVCDAALAPSPEATRSDSESALRAVMTKAHAPNAPTFMLCHDPKSALVINSNDTNFHVASTGEWRCGMLTGSALMPGFAALLQNLMRAASAPRGSAARKAPPRNIKALRSMTSKNLVAVATENSGSSSASPGGDDGIEAPLMSAWQVDFSACSANRVCLGPLPDSLDGFSFTNVAAILYQVSGGAVVAVAVSELPATRNSAVGAARIADIQRRFAAKELNAEELLRAMAFLPQESSAPQTADTSRARSAASSAGGSFDPTSVSDSGDGASEGSARSLGSTSSAENVLKSVRHNTIERDIVGGKVLLNPGKNYRMRGGQIIFVISESDEASESIFAHGALDRVAAQMGALKLSSEGRAAEEGYGFAIHGPQAMPVGYGPIAIAPTLASMPSAEDRITLSEAKRVAAAKFEDAPMLLRPNLLTVATAGVTALMKSHGGASSLSPQSADKPVSAPAVPSASSDSQPAGSLSLLASPQSVPPALTLGERNARRTSLSSALAAATEAELRAMIQPKAVVQDVAAASDASASVMLSTIVCRDVRKLTSPRAENHVIISCDILEAVDFARSVRRRHHLEHFGERPPIVVLLLSIASIDSASAQIAKALVGVPDVLIVRGDPAEFSSLERAGLEHCRSVILAMSGAKTGDTIERERGSRRGDEKAGKNDRKAAVDKTDDKRAGPHVAEVPCAELALQYAGVLRALSTIRTRRKAADKEAAARAPLSRVVSRQPFAEWKGPTIVLEVPDVEDVFLLQSFVNENLAQVLALTTSVDLKTLQPPSVRNLRATFSASAERLAAQGGSPAAESVTEGGQPSLSPSGAGAAVASAPPKGGGAKRFVAGDMFRKAANRVIMANRLASPLIKDVKFVASERKKREEEAEAAEAERRRVVQSFRKEMAQQLSIMSGHVRSAVEAAVKAPHSYLSPVYAQGNLYACSSLYRLLAQTFFSPLAAQLLAELLLPSDSRGGSVVHAVDVPRKFSRHAYGVVLDELRDRHDAIAIGLYRHGVPARDGRGTPKNFTLLSPPKDLILYSGPDGCDRIFVLTQRPVKW